MVQPIAIGLVSFGRYASTSDRTRAKVSVGVYAASEGLALIEVFEITGEPVRDESALSALANLARRAEASVLLTSGDVRSPRVVRLLNLTGLMAHEVGV